MTGDAHAMHREWAARLAASPPGPARRAITDEIGACGGDWVAVADELLAIMQRKERRTGG
jgi:hypothetical protein